MSDEDPARDQPDSRRRPAVAGYYQSIASKLEHGPIGELVRVLSTGVLDATAFESHLKRHGVAREGWHERQVVDLALGFIEECLQGGALTPHQLSDIAALNRFLRIDHGEFAKLRPAEVAAILGAQLERILEDSVMDDEEELQQVELQAVFGLGYDDYLALTRGAFERAYESLELQAAGRTSSSSTAARRKLQALEPLYRLAISRQRRPGALY